MCFFQKNGLFFSKIELFKAILVKERLPNSFRVGAKWLFEGGFDWGAEGAWMRPLTCWKMER